MIRKRYPAAFAVTVVMMMMVMSGGTNPAAAVPMPLKARTGAGAGALFVFGDSYADTGNHRNSSDTVEAEYQPWRSPYGITWPESPTGRYSDGHVFTDFYASYLGFRNPIPYRTLTEDAANGTGTVDGNIGINFAFGGSGVFPTKGFCPNVSTQILQLEDAINHGFVSRDTINAANASIALLTVNGNDYTQYVNNNGSLTNIAAFVQQVVEQIGSDVVSLVDIGFTKLTISNMVPAGCLPTATKTINFTSCSDTFNGLAVLHNALLKAEIEALKDKLPDVELITLDFFSAFNTTLLRSGIESNFRPCCEGIGDADCGSVDANGTALYTVCESPEQSFFWDDFHPTDAAWSNVTALLFQSSDLSFLRSSPRSWAA